MSNLWVNLGINLVALACVGIAGYLAINHTEGWGWFLFVGLMCSGSVAITTRKEKQ